MAERLYSHMSKETTIPEGRRRLAAVVREAGDIVQIADAERALDVSRTVAAKLLSRWSGQGWLRRVGPGAYAPVSLDSLVSEQVLDDPWVLVPALYDPGYIGGRTAAEHWDLTEQIFRDIVVMTERPVRAASQERHGASFTLRHVRAGMMFGTRSVWRGRTRIAVSDVHRTIIDMLDDPELGAGIQHVDDCLASYFGRKDRDDGESGRLRRSDRQRCHIQAAGLPDGTQVRQRSSSRGMSRATDAGQCQSRFLHFPAAGW